MNSPVQQMEGSPEDRVESSEGAEMGGSEQRVESTEHPQLLKQDILQVSGDRVEEGTESPAASKDHKPPDSRGDKQSQRPASPAHSSGSVKSGRSEGLSSDFTEPGPPDCRLSSDEVDGSNMDVTSFVPSVLRTEQSANEYSFQFHRPGQFQCSVTGLGFKTTGEGEVLYSAVQWEDRWLQSTGGTPSGPLFDVKCPQKTVCQLKLPRCGNTPDDDLIVAHISDEGLELPKPLAITETHVVVNVTHLSLFGILETIWNFFTGPQPKRVQVLLYYREAQTRTVSVLLLPRNVYTDEVQARHKNKRCIETNSNCHLFLNQTYRLQCSDPSSKVQPEAVNYEDDYGPNFHSTFRVSNCNVELQHFSLTLLGSDDAMVWHQDIDLEETMRLEALNPMQERTMAGSSYQVIDEESLDKKSWKLIGAGGFGQVFKARHRQRRSDVAIKILCFDDGSNSDRYLDRECELMRRAESLHVIHVLEVFKGRLPSAPGTQIGLVMELMERGSLGSLQKELNHPLPWSLVFRLAHQVSMGMRHLHSLTPPIIHKDLKPDNVLLDADLNVKITDFGLSKFIDCSTSTGTKGAGTISYMPPEALISLSDKTTTAFDVYSYGILLSFIVRGKQPYDTDPAIIALLIPRGQRPSLEEVDPELAPGLEDLVKLMKMCWHQEPKERPLFTECTAVTEALYEKHKPGMKDAVHQVVTELDQH